MSSSDKPWAFIPARGGSKRLPRKALAELGGKPLIHWTLDAAVDAGIFAEIVISSDDREILASCPQATMLHRRSDSLAQDDVTLDQVIAAFRRDHPIRDPLYLLLPTVPLRRASTILRAWWMFQDRTPSGVGGLLSLVPFEHPPEWALDVIGEEIRFRDAAGFMQARNSLRQAWRHDGGHYIITDIPGIFMPFFPPPEEVLDINTPDDLEFARWKLAQRAVNAVAI